MKYSTDLLHTLALAAITGTPDGSEAELLVPSVLNPVVEIPKAINPLSGFDVDLVQRTSFANGTLLSRAASQAALETVTCTFGRGLWRVVVRGSILSNFTQASDGTLSTGAIRLYDPSVAGAVLLKLYSVSGVPQHAWGSYEWLFIEDGWQIRTQIGSTGAGQTQEISTEVSAALLL